MPFFNGLFERFSDSPWIVFCFDTSQYTVIVIILQSLSLFKSSLIFPCILYFFPTVLSTLNEWADSKFDLELYVDGA